MRYPRLRQFAQAQASSLVSTAADFLVTIVAVELLRLAYVPASAIGNVAGGTVNFGLGRYVVFRAARQRAAGQGLRYLLVWLGSLGLNAGGLHLLTAGLHLNYVLSKVLVSLLVGVGFNYFLQLHFVFRKL